MENIYTKLSKVQSELKAPKSQYNSFGKYKYRSLEDIWEGVKPLLAEYKPACFFNDSIEKVEDRYYLIAEVTLVNTENSEEKIVAKAMAREPISKKGMDEAQITGATSSYARKYALNGLFAIDDTKDADAQEPVKKSTKRSSSPRAKPSQSDQFDEKLENYTTHFEKDFGIDKKSMVELLEAALQKPIAESNNNEILSTLKKVYLNIKQNRSE